MKRGKVTIGLRVHVEHNGSHNSVRGYFNMIAMPVIIGPNHYEMREIDRGHAQNIPSERVSWPSENEHYNGLELHNMQFWSQGNDDDTPRKLYGWDHGEYKNVSIRDAGDASRRAKTMRSINKKMNTIERKFGRPATFGAHLKRIAHSIGATKFVVPSLREHRDMPLDRIPSTDVVDVETGAYRVDGIVDKWVREPEETAKRAAEALPDYDVIQASKIDI